jgi:gamma-glutamyl-gamma-aminobutyrate hydrolase PuuD
MGKAGNSRRKAAKKAPSSKVTVGSFDPVTGEIFDIDGNEVSAAYAGPTLFDGEERGSPVMETEWERARRAGQDVLRRNIQDALDAEALEYEEKVLGKRGLPDGVAPQIILDHLGHVMPEIRDRLKGKNMPVPAGTIDIPSVPKPLDFKPGDYKDRNVILLGAPKSGRADDIAMRARHKVTLMRDHMLKFPTLCLSIHVEGPSWEEPAFAKLFARAGCQRADSLMEADLVIFTGGVDVDPQLYGEVPHPKTHIDPERDTSDINAYMRCLDNGIPMLGICRGAQFLHVMNGGKLYQDIDGHTGDHNMWDLQGKIMIENVSSVHHQSVIPNISEGMKIIATTRKSTQRWRNPTDCNTTGKIDVEAFFYPETCVIGIQGHPEYSGYSAFARWTLELIDQLVVTNPDIDWVGGHRRIKPELLAERQGVIQASIIPPAINVTPPEKSPAKLADTPEAKPPRKKLTVPAASKKESK